MVIQEHCSFENCTRASNPIPELGSDFEKGTQGDCICTGSRNLQKTPKVKYSCELLCGWKLLQYFLSRICSFAAVVRWSPAFPPEILVNNRIKAEILAVLC